MKQLFRCEYCDKIGTAEQIAEHEKEYRNIYQVDEETEHIEVYAITCYNCPNCNKEIQIHTNYCPYCGQKLSWKQNENEKES